MYLSEAFHASLKTLSERVESGFSLMERGFNYMEHLFHFSAQRLDQLEADLNRPAHHFFSKIERGMADHLSPEQQLTVLHACNTAYLQAMQQNQNVQQSVLSFPPVPPLTPFTTVPTSAAYHCTATCIPSQAGHHYTTPMSSVAGHSTPSATTMSCAAPVWITSTATVTKSWRTSSAKSRWATTSSPVRRERTSPDRSTATSPMHESTTTTPHHSRSTPTTTLQRTTTFPHRSTTTTTLQRIMAKTSPPHDTSKTQHQSSTATTSPDRSTAHTSPTRSIRHNSPSMSTVTTISPRSTASATTELPRGDLHSVFYSHRPRTSSSRRSSHGRRSHGGSRSRQVTPAPKKEKQKTLLLNPPSPSNVSQPSSFTMPDLPSPVI
ncbi:uncharacterized protein [Dendrobates tinctorius]|uniref:uncharacterized protein isoform X1 n=1 Tax=Dendrobates tinctorius TaxID=92724 RepID=UPI003CCA1D36